MFLATSNAGKNLLLLTYVGRVRVQELQRGKEGMAQLVAGLKPGFRVLVDMGRMESMDVGGTPEMAGAMDLLNEKGVATVVRVIPDPSKDIGLKILSLFHYHKGVQVMTCETMEEAATVLEI